MKRKHLSLTQCYIMFQNVNSSIVMINVTNSKHSRYAAILLPNIVNLSYEKNANKSKQNPGIKKKILVNTSIMSLLNRVPYVPYVPAWSTCPRANMPKACQLLIFTCQRANVT